MRKPSILNDPQHWRRRAIEARRISQQLTDPTAKETMLAIANSYDQLANLAEERNRNKPTT